MGRDYSNITVVGIHGAGGGKKMLPAIEKTAAALPGSKKLLITDKVIKANIPQKFVAQGLDYAGYSHFVIYCLHSYIDTEFALIVQDDGWALNPDAWNDEFMDYDYVGGLTHAALANGVFYKWYQWIGKANPLVVQNGGFSLRSKSFLQAPSQYGIVMHQKELKELNNEDIQLCCFMRPAIEATGLRFAPEDVARRFSFEHLHPLIHGDLDLKTIFGHHSRFRRLKDAKTMEWHLSDEQMKNIVWEDKVLQLFKDYGYKICHTHNK